MLFRIAHSLLTQLLVAILVLLVLPITLSGYYLHKQITSSLDLMIKEKVTASNKAAHSLLHNSGNNLLDIAKSNSYWEAHRIAIKKHDIDWINTNVLSAIDTNPDINFISVYQLNGKMLTQVGDIKEFTVNLESPKIFKQLEKEKDFSGLVQTSKGLALIAVSGVTNDSGNADPTGILIFGKILEDEDLKKMKETLVDNIAVLTNEGVFLKTDNNIKKETLLKDLVAIKKTKEEHIFLTTQMDSTHYGQMSTTIKDLNNQSIGILYVSQKQQASTEVKQSLSEINIIISLILFLAITILSFILFWFIIKPIKHLVKLSEEASTGVLTKGMPLEVTERKDEIGKLSSSMNKMIGNFRLLIKGTTNMIGQVDDSIKELSAISDQTTNTTHQIVASIQEVASGSETQLQRALEASLAIEEMAKEIQQIDESVFIVSKDSAKTEEDVNQGNKSIQHTIRQIEKINQSFTETRLVVHKLTERSNEIVYMATLLTKIANQTNLLALNASIEAARSGEHGKGFTVVANEVKKLAEQTKVSAKQVSQLIAQVQQESSISLQSMDDVSKEVLNGVKQINEVGTTFSNILTATRNAAKQSQAVSGLTEEIAAGSEEITTSVDTMATIAKTSTELSQNVASSSQEQLAAMEEINSSTQTLTRMVEELKKQINQFKI